MCERHPDRDERGRLLPGHSGNPAGRRSDSPAVRLVRAAEDCGAQILVLVPPRRAKASAPADDTPPRAA